MTDKEICISLSVVRLSRVIRHNGTGLLSLASDEVQQRVAPGSMRRCVETEYDLLDFRLRVGRKNLAEHRRRH